MPFVIKRKMEKLGWADAVEKVGNPTLSEGSGSGLSGTDYFRLKREFCSLDDSEYVVCFTTGSTTSSVVQTIFHWEWVVTFELKADTFTVYTYDFGTATGSDIATLSPNTKYWIKVNLDGCSKKISLSEDGISYNELISFTEKVVRPMQYLPTMGSHATLERPFLGVYHFNECVAKYTRRYLTRDPRVGEVINATKIGNPKVEGLLASEFSRSSVFVIENPTETVTSLEIVFKVKTPSNMSVRGCVYGQHSTNIHTPQLELPNGSSGTVRFAIPLGDATWNSVFPDVSGLLANTVYWFKGTWDNSSKKSRLYYSTDGVSYTLGAEATHDSFLWDQVMQIGNDQWGDYFRGSIDFSQCYININGSRWWDGTKIDKLNKAYLTEMAPPHYEFTINATPENAIVTINGETRNNISVVEVTTVEWSVSLDGYTTQSGSLVLNEDTVIDVVLEEEQPQGDILYYCYEADNWEDQNPNYPPNISWGGDMARYYYVNPKTKELKYNAVNYRELAESPADLKIYDEVDNVDEEILFFEFGLQEIHGTRYRAGDLYE